MGPYEATNEEAMKQGQASVEQSGAQNSGTAYRINQNFPSQLGTAIDPKAEEKFGHTAAAHIGPTPGMGEGPGANRTVRLHGGQGEH
jgi:hypothetical protein